VGWKEKWLVVGRKSVRFFYLKKGGFDDNIFWGKEKGRGGLHRGSMLNFEGERGLEQASDRRG